MDKPSMFKSFFAVIFVHAKIVIKNMSIIVGESWWNIDLPIISVENDLSHSWEKLGDTEFYICAKCGLTKTKCSVSSCDNGIGENINCSEMVIRNIIK